MVNHGIVITPEVAQAIAGAIFVEIAFPIGQFANKRNCAAVIGTYIIYIIRGKLGYHCCGTVGIGTDQEFLYLIGTIQFHTAVGILV